MAEKPQEIRLLLVTTGETEWCHQQRLLGSTDLPLSDSGLRSVRTSAEQIRPDRADARRAVPQKIAAVWCGPDEASKTTARVFAEAQGAKVRSIEGLANPGLGLWEGLCSTDAADKFCKAFKQWSEDPSSVLPPEGESFQAAEERILSSLARAVRKHKGQGAIALVLRPTANAIVRCWLESLPASRIGWMINRSPMTEWRSVPRERFEAVLTRLKTAS